MGDYDSGVRTDNPVPAYQPDTDTGVERAAGSITREAMPADLQRDYDALVAQFGQKAVDDALRDNATNQFSDDLIAEIRNSDLPPQVQEAVIEKLEALKAATGGNAGSDVAEAVDEKLGGFVDDLSRLIMQDLIKELQEQTKQAMAPGSSGGKSTNGGEGKGGAGAAGGTGGGARAAQGAGGGASAGGTGEAEGMGDGEGVEESTAPEGAQDAGSTKGAEDVGGAEDAGGAGGGENWLISLAKAMGQISGEFLEKMVKTGKELGAMGGSEGSEGLFAEKNAEMQAAAQMFKIAQEALATVVKTAGEGLISVSRKS